MADGILGAPEVTGLTRTYEEAEAEPEYCAKLAYCRTIAEALGDRYGIAAR